MKFNENLVNLRKSQKMSQEQLAEKLNVSRQAVSKWESGQSYPEMDKIIAMCKIFDCSMDSLVNEEVPLKQDNQDNDKKTFEIYKNKISKVLDKVFETLARMSPKEFIKCLVYLALFAVVLYIAKFPVNYLIDLGRRFLDMIPYPLGNYASLLWKTIFDIGYFIAAILLLGYLFKRKYMDKEMVQITNVLNEDTKNSAVSKDEKVKEVKEVQVVKEGITFSQFIYKMFKYFLKFLALLIALPFVFTLLFLIVALIISVYLLIHKVFYLGIYLGIIGSIILDIVIIKILFNFIFNWSFNPKRIFGTFIISFFIVGAGIGLSILEIADSSFVNEAPTQFKIKNEEFTVSMQEDLKVDDVGYFYNKINFETDESLTTTVKVNLAYYDDFGKYEVKVSEDGLSIYPDDYNINLKKILDVLIQDMQNKKYHNYNYLNRVNLTIKSSAENINKIRENTYNNYEEQRQVELENYELYQKLDEKDSYIWELEEKLRTQEEEYQMQLEEYKQKIEDYKAAVNSLEE